MIEHKQQQEALELVAALEQLAVETEMKLRIVDALRERKLALQSTIADGQWAKELLMIGEAVAYMEKQFSEGEAVIANDGDAVSRDEIRRRIQEIWSLCGEMNRELQNSYLQTQAASWQKLKSDMMDWANVAANYEMMSHPSRFRAKCQETGQIYRQQMDSLAFAYVDESAGEYHRSMNKIKGLITAVGRGQLAVSMRDIYEKWESRQEAVRQNLKKNAQQMEKGEDELFQFGQTHAKAMERIIRQKKRKQMFYCLIPFLAVFVLFLAGVGISSIRGNTEQPQEEAVQEEDSFGEKLKSEVISQTSGIITRNIVGNLLHIIGTILIPLAILPMLGCCFWIWYTKTLYRRWLLRDLEGYLRPKVEDFWRENKITARGEVCFRQVGNLVGQRYDGMLQDVVGDDFGMKEDDSPKMRMKELSRKWNAIKYM